MRDAVEVAREQVATLLGARAREVVFTSGGTEAANWVNRAARMAAGPDAPIALAAVEHSAVRVSAESGGPVAVLGVDGLGRIDLDELDALLARAVGRPALVHCQAANHEVGTVQPYTEVAETCQAAGVALHVDACAAAGYLRLDRPELASAAISVSSHKLGGPPGIGALVVRRGRRLAPFLLGGDQERGRRGGMENVVGILGFGAAAAALCAPGVLESESERARAGTERLLAAASAVEGVVSYGDPVDRLPHLICVGVPDVEAEGLVLGLDRSGISVHSGSACSSESLEPSPVLEAMGVEADRSLRCSVGWSTTDDDLAAFEAAFPAVVAGLRALRG
ncbi:MAG: cysteine desulfurase family protein [Acidimicrobiaceae bacterium]|nr:cysteine desulfurase family protein [Acidimicrobiaceae bacterium]